MTPLTKFINKRERSIKSLQNKITKNEEKIDKLKSKITIKRGRYNKNDKKAQNNVKKRKELKNEISIWKAQIRKYKKEIKQHNYYKERIQVMFKSKTFKTAMNRYNKLNDKFEELPKIIQEFLKKLSKKLKRAFEYTQNNKIPKTNNLIELLFRTTFPGRIKRIFRTYEREKNKIKLNNIRWFERQVFQKYTKN